MQPPLNSPLGQAIEFFQDFETKRIFGWEIGKTGATLERKTNKKNKITHNFVLKGYYTLKDSIGTEKLFNVIIEAILIKFATEELAGTQGPIVPQAKPIQFRIFGKQLAHYSEIHMDVSEIIETPTDDSLDELLGLNLKYFLKDVDDGEQDAADNITLPTS